MKKVQILVATLSLCVALFSCQSSKNVVLINDDDNHILESKVLTAKKQSELTPEDVLKNLKKGNAEFLENNLTIRNNTARVRQAADGQYPEAVILSCLDSRVPVEDVFHKGLGDIFVARVAGNIVNEDILGSLEYACKVSGSKLIVVLGHGNCGAVSSAIKDVKLGNITALLSKITPSVKKVSENFEGEKSAKNPKFVDAVCEANVHHAIDEIRAKSPILKEMEDDGDIMIVGANYNIETGKVDFFKD